MFLMRISIVLLACLALSAQVAWAAPGGGMDGGGGGGNMVPEYGEGGPSLMKKFKIGIELLADGDCKRAEDQFEKVLKVVPRSSQANYLRGIALQCMKRFKTSIRYFRKAKFDDAEYYPAYGALGISYLATGRLDRAMDELEELSRFKKLCEEPRRICPPELLKAHEKLSTAIERAEGVDTRKKRDDSG